MTKTAPDSSKRWNAFQCPSCFGLFRIQRFNLGRKGRCPICQAVTAIPGVPEKPENAAPGEHPRRTGADEELLDKIMVATPMTEEELAARAASKAARRRVYTGAMGAEELDWEDEGQAKSNRRISGYLIGSVAMLLTLILVVAAYFIKNSASQRPAVTSTTVYGDEVSAQLQQSLQDTIVKPEGEEALIDSVDEYAKFDLQRIDEVIQDFLNTNTVEDRAKLIREPARVIPLMKKFYGGDQFEAEGYEALNRTQVSYRNNFLNTTVRTADFLPNPIAVERVGDGDEAQYLVDWESWTGYCEIKPEDAREKKPTDPFLMRCIISPGDYYNFEFQDDQKWNSHKITFRGSLETFQAYTAKGSKADEALKQLRQDNGTSPYVVKVRYPKNARADDQVEIVEVICLGWIVDLAEKK